MVSLRDKLIMITRYTRAAEELGKLDRYHDAAAIARTVHATLHVEDVYRTWLCRW